jgi:trimeric autotransporter adhesin
VIRHISNYLFRSRFTALTFLALMCAGLAGAQTLTMISGNGQLGLSQFQSFLPLVVQATGSNGQPAAGVTVTWAIASGTGLLKDLTTTTDSNGLTSTFFTGVATDQVNSYFVANITASTATSSVTFISTTVPNAGNLSIVTSAPTNGQTFTAQSGTTIPGVAQVQVLVQGGFLSGTGIPNVGLTVANYADQTAAAPASCSATAGTALTDSNGVGTCNLVVNGPAGTTQLVVVIGGTYLGPVFNLQIKAGTPCTYSLSSSSQSFDATGGNGSVNVTTSTGCGWTATSNANFIGITSGASGTGNGTVSYNVAANTGAARSGTLTIGGKTFTVNQSAPNTTPSGPSVSTTNLPAGTIGAAYSTTLMASGGQQPYTWSFNGTLPSGLSLTPSTGVISGIPQSSGVYGFSVTVTDAGNKTAQQNLSITINGTSTGGFAITNVSFANGAVGQAYSQPLTAANFCTTPFQQNVTFSISSGSLPPGLKITFNTNGSQSITGTPTTTGAFSFTLQAADACGHSVSASFTITISTPGAPAQQMTVSATALAFTAQVGGAAPAAQSVNIGANSGALSYSVKIAITSGGNWLVTQSPTTGTTPASFSVSVNVANLTAGTYNGSITITSPASNSPVVIPVTLTVSAGPMLVLQSPAAVTVTQTASANQSSTPVSQVQIALASGATPVSFTAAATTNDGAHWLTVLPAQGMTPATLVASVNTGGLAVGTYTGTVAITPASGSPIVVTITANVTQNAPAVVSLLNGASFLLGSVSPGEIISIFGTALGPVNAATLQLDTSGKLTNSLAGVQILFDGTPAPMIYSSAGQLSAIVPYEVAGKTSTSVTVQYLTVKSSAITVPVATSAPGIFTLGGTSQGAILNQDSTVNGASNPASPGSVIQIFATGEGQTQPAGIDGSVTGSTLPMPILPVSVQINGETAKVIYAGAAPGEPAGVLQVDAIVPADVTTGAVVPITIQVGTVYSQPGVTLAISK